MKPTAHEIQKAIETLKSAGYAVENLFSIDDVDIAIESSLNPQAFSSVTDEQKLMFLNTILEYSVQDINESLEFSIDNLL